MTPEANVRAQLDTELADRYLQHRSDIAKADVDSQFRELLNRSQDSARAAPESSTPGAIGRTARDIGTGVVETPRAVVKGARDAFSSLFNMGDDLASWVAEKAPYLSGGFQISERGLELLTPEQVAERGIGSGVQTWSGPTPDDESQPADATVTATGDLLPDLAAPRSVTGGVVKSIAQFVTGMAGASRLLGGTGYLASAAKGALADFTAFDPEHERLSNLIEQYPALSNPVTRYLQAQPDDGAAEGRFKNAIEGLGLGAITDGFVRGVKLLRQTVIAKRAAEASGTSVDDAMRVALEQPGTLADDAFERLGSEAENAPLVKLRQSPATLNDVRGGTAAEPQTFINFARIDAPDDVKRVMQRLADVGASAADEARAGVRSFADVKLDAVHQNAWDVLLARRAGQPLGDAEALAARQLWAATTDKVAELAEAAAAQPSEANLFAFRKMLDVHDLVQREVLGARASTARALAQWRIPAGGGAERLRDVANALDASGGSEVAKMLADRVSRLAKAGMLTELQTVVEKTAYARTRDAVLEGWVLGLLTNPVTHVKNVVSNAAYVPINMAERATAARLSQFLGNDAGVAVGEATSQWFGLVNGLKDAFRFAAKAARTMETGAGVNRLELPRQRALSSEALRLSSSSWLGRAVDLLGSAYQLTGRGLAAEDEFFKTVGYRMEIHAQALRQATAEAHAGSIDDVASRVAELVANPPQHIRLAAVDQALYQTFQQTPGDFGQWLMRGKRRFPGFNVLVPFLRTTVNLQRATFERTPLAPLVGQWRADIAAGGARRDLALARMGLGTIATLAVADATLSGQISGRGPVERGQRQAMAREGWQPYSVKIGDRWYAYNGIDPSGGIIGLAADTAETLMHLEHEMLDDPDVENLVAATAAAAAGNLLNKSYLSTFSSFIEAMNSPEQSASRFLEGLAGSVVPSGVGHVARLTDPYMREVYSMLDAVQARIPGMSDNLPPRRDLWGEPISRESGLGKPFDALSPARSPKPTPEPIDQEIVRLGVNLAMPPRRVEFGGTTINLTQYPEAYSRYVELAGNELKHPAWNMGAKDYLNAVISGKHEMSEVYRMLSDGPDGGKDVFIRDTVRDYRERARRQLLEEYPDLRGEIEHRRERSGSFQLLVR